MIFFRYSPIFFGISNQNSITYGFLLLVVVVVVVAVVVVVVAVVSFVSKVQTP